MTYAELLAGYTGTYTLFYEAGLATGRWVDKGVAPVNGSQYREAVPGNEWTVERAPVTAVDELTALHAADYHDPINGPGPDSLTAQDLRHQPPSPRVGGAPVAEVSGTVLVAPGTAAGPASVTSTSSAPNPCPACYYAEHGMAHSYTSACKESRE